MSALFRTWFRYRTKHLLMRFTAVCALLCVCSPAQAIESTVIVNESVKKQEFSRTDIRNIFSARTQYWPDGAKITVYVLDAKAEAHQDFCRNTLKMFPYQLERIWNQIAYSGQGERPQVVTTEQALIEAVKNTPGAIGYAYQAGELENVREVAVQ